MMKMKMMMKQFLSKLCGIALRLYGALDNNNNSQKNENGEVIRSGSATEAGAGTPWPARRRYRTTSEESTAWRH